MGVGGRAFRRKCAKLWRMWPLPQPTGEIRRVVFADGTRIAKNARALIAGAEKHAVGRHLARPGNPRTQEALIAPAPPPEAAATDDGAGFEKARRALLPDAAARRGVFHAFSQVKKQTATRSSLQAGVELYGLAKMLLHVGSIEGASEWPSPYNDWYSRWGAF